MQKNCVDCGELFETTYLATRTKWCSRCQAKRIACPECGGKKSEKSGTCYPCAVKHMIERGNGKWNAGRVMPKEQRDKIVTNRLSEKICATCGQLFLAKERKARYCENCKKCLDCGKPITPNSIGRRCRSCSRQTDASVAQRTMLHATMFGENNVSKRPEVRKAISDAMLVNHPSKLYPEKWKDNARKHIPYRTSKLEDLVAPFLPRFVHLFKVKFYELDFADEQNKIAIEVQGCWFHNCQQCFPGSPSHKTQHACAANDKRKHTYLTNRGWTIIYIWEHDIRKDAEGTVRTYVYD